MFRSFLDYAPPQISGRDRQVSHMAGIIFHEYQLLRITLRCSSLNLRIQRIYL